MRRTECPRALPIQARRHRLGGKNESVRGHHEQWSWLIPQCQNPDAFLPTTMPIVIMGHYQLYTAAESFLPLELLAADNLLET